MNSEFEKLEKALKGLEKPILNSDLKSKIKSNVLMQIQNKEQMPASLSRFGAALGKLASFIQLPAVAKARIRERILTHIGADSANASPFGFQFKWQRVLASVFVVVFVASSVTYYISDIPITKAKARLHKVTGNVEVLRGEERIKAEANMDLEQGDTVVTGDDGIAVISYVDKSVTRLSPKTELKIKKVEEIPNEKPKTAVSVELTQGRVWTQVVDDENDPEDVEIKVETKDIVASASDSASFDVQQKEAEKVQIAVYGNKVAISLPEVDTEEERKQYVQEGYSFNVEEQQPKVSDVTSAIETEEDELWVNLNTASDIEFIESVKEVNMLREAASEPVVETDSAQIQKVDANIETDTAVMLTISPKVLE